MTGLTTRLAAALAYPRSPSDWVELVHPLYSSHEIRGRVLGVRRESRDVSTLVLALNGRWPGHRAGQHVALTVEIDGVRRTRCFSVASRPGACHLELTVKAQRGGEVTPHLVFGTRPGTRVVLSPPRGDFVLPRVLPPRLLLLGGGSGITPLMSMLRQLHATRASLQGVTFVQHARSREDVLFAGELHGIAASTGLDLRVHGTPLQAGSLRELARVPAWACGPPGFLDVARAAFAATGSEHLLHTERFSLPSRADGAGTGQVTFVRSGRRAEGRRSLLVMAEGAGLSPPSGCRMGICRTCTCRKVSGVTRDLRSGALSTEAGVDIQLCIHAPVGPVEIDL